MRILTSALFLVFCLFGSASAREITIATWNLGWHVDKATAATWISRCDGLFEKDPATGVWKSSSSGGGIPGWQVNFREEVEWDWAMLPVCNVFQDRSFKTVPATIVAYDRRLQQLRDFFESSLRADIYAFQEVSGEKAVRDALPNGGNGFEICSFTTFKVQRLAIAWKTDLGKSNACTVNTDLSLPSNPEVDQPRPGLSVDLSIDGKIIRILVVHMKSSCVSPLEARGDLTAADSRDCKILQQQVIPLEKWVEDQSRGVDKIVILGDFNRNFWHEQHDNGPVRADSSSAKDPLPEGVLVKDLFGEVFDGVPASSSVTLLPETCLVNAETRVLCEKSETVLLTGDEKRHLSRSQNLGCRNPLGLDHILIGSGIMAAGAAEHVAVGVFGGSKMPDTTHPDPLLAISDHCPMMARLVL